MEKDFTSVIPMPAEPVDVAKVLQYKLINPELDNRKSFRI